MLSPPINETLKRYQWTPEFLLQQNRYYLPEDLEPNTSDNQQNENKKSTEIKIPPIYLKGPLNHKNVISDIKKLIESDFTTNYTPNFLKINLTNENDYRNLVKHYRTNNVEFHSYQNPNSKPLSVVIKNVPPSLSQEDLEEELKPYNLPIIKITRLWNKDKTPMPVCAVDLTASEKADDVYKINQICNSIVTVELRRKSNNTPQCHRCQRYGHTKNYCSLEPRCVRCLGKHLYNQCDKKKNEPPVCTNCGENHPANYRGCRIYQESTQSRNQQRPINRANTVNAKLSQTPSGFKQRSSYANAAKNPTQNTGNQFLNTPNINETTQSSSVFNSILLSILNLIKPYLDQIKKFLLTNLVPMLLNDP